MRSEFSRVLASVACLYAVGCGGTVQTVSTTPSDPAPVSWQSFFLVNGSESNFGETTLASGFVPDPFQVQVVSGSTTEDEVDVASTGLMASNGGTCTGYATREPDFILHLSTPSPALRLFVNAATAEGDTTLIINDGAGNWWCSDDDGGNLNPMVDIENAPAGQYDIWVGSYNQDTNIQGTLSVTELLGSVHP